MIREDQSSSIPDPPSGRSIRVGGALAAIAVALAALPVTSRADDRPSLPGATRAKGPSVSDNQVQPESLEALLSERPVEAPGPVDRPPPKPSSRSVAPRAVARLIGTTAPGLRVTLDGSASTGQPSWYRWVQVQGPPVALDADDRPTATLMLPPEASSLAFLLVVGNAAGADLARLAVPVEANGRPAAIGELRADAGDDQIGQVGRQVTLNGLRSAPRGRLGYRWMQVAGPKVVLRIEDGHVFTFVPPASGLYQFALVVASGSEISEPDLVNVAVGVPLPPPDEPAAAPAPVSLRDLARAVLANVEGGRSAGSDLAEAFEEIASRMDLYQSYSELMLELTRRLEEIVPADPLRRSAWLERVFAPLTVHLIDRMRSEGLDLSRPDGQAAEMTRPQRKVLAQQFRIIAEGFQSADTSP
jgi:hypothetical protein